MTYVEAIARHGFAVLEDVIDSETVDALLRAVTNANRDLNRERAEKAFGIRNLLNVVPFTRELANHSTCRSIVEPILGSTAGVVRGIYFDKHKDATRHAPVWPTRRTSDSLLEGTSDSTHLLSQTRWSCCDATSTTSLLNAGD